MNRLDTTCEQARMANLRDKYYNEFLRAITDCNNLNDAPLLNDKIQEAHKAIAEEESYAQNVTVDTFSQASNTQRDHANMILTSEKQDKSNDLEETLKDMTINDAEYYISDSLNANDANSILKSNPEIFNHTSYGKKRKVTDTSKDIL